MRRSVPLALLAALVAAPAAHGQTVSQNKHLWATVNICDTPKTPNTIGVRASMPGSGKKGERMWMRFRVQFHSDVDHLWHNFVNGDPDSGFQPVGAATFKTRQSGWTFPFNLQPGEKFEMRGVVNFEWRKGKKVVRTAVKKTSGGHKTALAEPKGYSAATCVISG